MSESGERRGTTIVVLTCVAMLCRLAALWQPMRFDESVSWAQYVGRSFTTIAATYQQPNNHVLYSLLAKLSAQWAGYAPWALRAPAFVAGVAIVPLTWAVGRRFASETSALLAAAFAAGSTQLVLYSTNARGYTLIVALFLLLLVVADRLRKHATLGRWLAFVLIGAAGFYCIPVMLYPFGIVAIWLLLASGNLHASARVRFQLSLVAACAATGVLAAALYFPIIQSAGVSALTGNRFVAPVTWHAFVGDLPRMVAATLVTWTSPLPMLATPLVVVLALMGIRRSSRDATESRPSLALATLVWCSALLIATHRAPFTRVWLFLLPLYFLAVARGIERLVQRVSIRPAPSRRMIVAVGALLALGEGLTRAAEELDDTGAFRSAEQVTAILAPRLRAGDRVLAPIPIFGPLLYYFPRAGADTAMLTVPLASSRRAFLVLDGHQHQTLQWAIVHHVIDPRQFATPILLASFPDGELWEANRR